MTVNVDTGKIDKRHLKEIRFMCQQKSSQV